MDRLRLRHHADHSLFRCRNEPSPRQNGAGATLLKVDCDGLYVGGAGGGAPLPLVVPDTGRSILNITTCNTMGAITLGATTPADSGSNRNGTAAGVICIPPSFNVPVDAAGDLPRPGAVALP